MGNQKVKSVKQVQLRESSLMTKIMLGDQKKVIQHLKNQNVQLSSPINQMGDTIMHYATYRRLKIILDYLLARKANFQLQNSRGLSALDLAEPQLREWLIKQTQMVA